MRSFLLRDSMPERKNSLTERVEIKRGEPTVPAVELVPKLRGRHVRDVRFHIVEKQKKRAPCGPRRAEDSQHIGVDLGCRSGCTIELGGIQKQGRNFADGVSELIGFLLVAASLLNAEFLPKRHPRILVVMLAWSLLIFVQLSFGQWLTSDFNATAQLFAYFAGTLVALMHVNAPYHSLQLPKSQPAP